VTRLQYIGIKEEGQPFRVVNRALLDQELTVLPKGRYRLTIEKYRKSKSNAQLGYLFACVYPFVLRGLTEAGWDDITTLDQVDALCKSMFSNQEIVNKDTAEILTIPALKREMTTTEMMTYVESIRTWAREFLQIEIPEPQEQLTLL
jgi:hypothetical protein